MSISSGSAPFADKYKLECECSACNSRYKIIYFEDEVSGEMIVCPFCGEGADEYSETNKDKAAAPAEATSETLYTDDEEALYENETVDDDDVSSTDSSDDE